MNDELLGPVYDILQGKTRTIPLYDSKGSVDLIDCSPRLCPVGRTLDYAAARAARTSYNSGMKSPTADEGLVCYLVRNWHTSPLEFINFTFRVTCPIFVARQIMRHRTTSINEVSARYTVLPNKFFIPETLRINNQANKQSSGGEIKEGGEEALKLMRDAYDHIYKNYEKLLEMGVAREIARSILPVGIFTQFYITMNMNNFLKFLTLRMAQDCQYETRVVADAMFALTRELSPAVFKAWKEYNFMSMTLSTKDVIAIKNRDKELVDGSKGENGEFKKKLSELGLDKSF